jgi:hypothetical protein
MRTLAVAVLALIFGAGGAAADSISFNESYTERLRSDQSVNPAHAGSFKAAVTHPELGCMPLVGGMPFELTVGGISFQSPLGAADVISSSQFTFFVRDDFGQRIGTITLRRNFSQLLVTASFSRLPISIVADDLLGEAGPVSGSIGARIVFGSFEVNRPVYFSGRQSVTQRVIDDEVFDFHSIAVAGTADYSRPVLSIASPRPGQRFETNTITLRGGVRDNVAAVSVQVQANGIDFDPVVPSEIGDWQSIVGLTPGTNVIAVWAMDQDGNVSATNTLRIFYVVKASLTLVWDGEGNVTGLTNGQPLEIGRGYKLTARPVATTRFGGWSGGGEYGPIQSAVAALNFIMQPGMELRASFIPPVLAPLTLEVTPGNDVAGVSSGTPLEIGSLCQATARPGPGNLFLGWSGSVQSSNATLRFIMQSNMVLQANFAPNPWLPLAGDYAGLVMEELKDTSQPPFNSGFFAVTLTANGRITGKLRLRGESLPFSAQADLDGKAIVRVPRPKCTEPLMLELLFDVIGKSGGVISGAVSSPTIYSELAGNRAVDDATYAGRYTFRILSTPEEDPPDGEGAGTILVDARGHATVSGTLGDGTPFVFSTLVFRDGFSPFDTPIYGGRGLLQGWVNFATNLPPLHVEGTDMIWFKALSRSDRYYPSGFVTHRYFMATRYTPPVPGSNALGWSEGVVGFKGGEFSEALGARIHVTNNIVRPADSFPKVTVTLTPKTGLFTVGLVHPITGKKLSGKGALLQFEPPYEGFGFPISGIGAGWFRGTTESGYVLILPLGPPEGP